ncbi:DUF1738 domain-containing protein [Methylobacterium sp. WL12]|uniref:ArdC family protein n=1 Tax=Methylobacterium sp. WL12 TaxID=2603890 RepID=UPI0011CB21AD|nr:zincin-like metallopeptidase domain-containing protein [Methylobacterium sp. WL12]TXM71678.1 DUF1738 domain-containing protein [Methylobacterium sp. WL12]
MPLVITSLPVTPPARTAPSPTDTDRTAARDATPQSRITAQILAQLETADPAAWTPPWHGADPLPCNALTGWRYSGINILVLWVAAQANDYTDPRWATYRQWAALGAQVRRGERGTAVLFYRDLTLAGTDTVDGADHGPRFVARTSHVFNAAQVDGASDRAAHLPTCSAHDPLPVLTTFISATGAQVVEAGTRAYYNLRTDTIRLPPQISFHTTEGYAATLAHELIHWTGAPQRLGRDFTGSFGKQAYAAEELVAELGAAFVLADLNIARSPHPDHANYLAHWLPLLRTESRALATAAGHASRAAAYLADLQVAVGRGPVDIGASVIPAGSSQSDATTGPIRAAA